jgi:hypothetical protein
VNTRLANFLLWIVSDPDHLAAFNNDDQRGSIISNADISEDDRAALLTGDSAEVLRQLSVSEDDEVSWVVNPGIKKFMVGFGIKKGPSPPSGSLSASAGKRSRTAARSSRSRAGGRTASKGARKSAGGKRRKPKSGR